MQGNKETFLETKLLSCLVHHQSLGSKDPPALDSQIVETEVMYPHTHWKIKGSVAHA